MMWKETMTLITAATLRQWKLNFRKSVSKLPTKKETRRERKPSKRKERLFRGSQALSNPRPNLLLLERSLKFKGISQWVLLKMILNTMLLSRLVSVLANASVTLS
jgi:hypothetical protein